MIAKFRPAQLVFLDGKKTVKIKRIIKRETGFEYELRETGEIIPESRLSLLKQ